MIHKTCQKVHLKQRHETFHGFITLHKKWLYVSVKTVETSTNWMTLTSFFLKWIEMFYLWCVNAIRMSFLSVTLKFDEALTEVKHCCAAVLTRITSADCSCPKTRFCWACGHMNQLTKCDLKSCAVTVWGAVGTNYVDDVSKVLTQRRDVFVTAA